MASSRVRTADLVGLGKLAVDAVLGLTDVVESMHGTIARVALPLGPARPTQTRGLTRLVYQTIRGATRVLGGSIDLVRAGRAVDAEPIASPRRDAFVAVLNGVIGDHLAAVKNPLAMPMQLHVSDASAPTGRVLVLVHGLCCHYQQWKRRGHDHGAVLGASHGFTSVYASFNSGRHISENGAALADELERVLAAWPVPITEVVLLGHSMGGLVARSACDHAQRTAQRWLAHLTKLVSLGTPHHGAPLERAGSLASIMLDLSPYAAPIGRIGTRRSAGIRDLRHGNVREADWATYAPNHRPDVRTPLPLPENVACFAIAATTSRESGGRVGRLAGDGLVPVASALGQHPESAFALAFPAAHQRIIYACGHLDLLDSAAVAAQLASWLR